MREDVERPGIAVRQVARRLVVGLGVVQEDAAFVGRPAVRDAVDLQVDAIVAMLS